MIKPEFTIAADGKQLDKTTITDDYILEQKIKREKLMRELQKIHFAERCKDLLRR